MTSPHIRVVHDSKDTPDHARQLRSLHHPVASRLSLSLTSYTAAHSSRPLLDDLATALGKRAGLGADPNEREEGWEWLQCWLVAEGVREVFLSRAHLLGISSWQQLAELAHTCDFDLWLIYQRGTLATRHEVFIRDWDLESLDWRTFWKRVSHKTIQRAAQSIERTGHGFPPVPDEAWTHFLPTARTVLSADDYAVVRDTAAEAGERIDAWLSSRADVSLQEAADFVLGEIANVLTADETITRLHGMQAGAMRAGWHMRVRADVLRARRGAEPPGGLDAPAARRLRWYLSPRHAAVGAATLAARLDAPQLSALDVGNIPLNGASIGTPIGETAIPAHARPLLTAQRLACALEGAAADTPLITSASHRSRRGERSEAPGIAYFQRNIEKATGLLLRPSLRHSHSRSNRTLLNGYGVTLEPLHGGDD